MPLILPSNSISAGGFAVNNSLRFEQSSSDYMTRTFGTPTSSQTWTLSFWIKRSKLSSTQFFFNTDGGNEEDRLHFDSNDRLIWFEQNSSAGTDADLTTNRVFRDVSAWYHIVIARDSTQATSSNRIKIYVNGVQETSFASSTYPSLNDNSRWNTAVSHEIGARNGGTFVSAYLSEITFIDGQQLDPTSFGEFDEDTGIWKPIDVSGLTFGTNGFYLPFKQANFLGTDESGNSNDFTVNNLTSIDQTTDTPTNNYATLNPLAIPTSGGANTFSNGNLEITNSADANRTSFSTLGVSKGKWYYECKVLSGEMKQFIGISKPQDVVDRIGNSANSYGYSTETARKYNNGSFSSYGTTASSGDIIMVAFDSDNGTIWVGKNGTWFNSATQTEIENGTTTNAMYSSITIDDFFVMGVSVEDSNIQMNFGSPMYSISSGNSDGNGYGNFEYSVPSGYYALNTKNLAEYG